MHVTLPQFPGTTSIWTKQTWYTFSITTSIIWSTNFLWMVFHF